MKIVIIAPHLSTGGMPQYLLWYIKEILPIYPDITIIEYSNVSDIYTVQKDKIRTLVEVITIGDDKKSILITLNNIKPDIIHFMEVPELFMESEITKEIYSNNTWVIETTHTSSFNTDLKTFLPDKFIFPCEFSRKQYEKFEIPSDICEYTHEIPIKIPKSSAQEKLGLDPNYKHVINIGLFTPGKNQKELIELAAKCLDHKIVFHFIGNQADNFKNYWEPLLKNLPTNCKVWGERKDVDTFYAAADLMYFCSKEELNPICIKEALAHKLPILCYNLLTYLGIYSKIKLINFIDKSVDQLLGCLKLTNNKPNFLLVGKTKERTTKPTIKLVHLLSLPDTDREILSIKDLAPLVQFGVRYIQHINPPTTILPDYLKQNKRPDLTPGHLGCFQAFRRAIQEEFTDDIDFLMVCEGDCKLICTQEEFYKSVINGCGQIITNSINYFSFGDAKDLEAGVLQSERITNGLDNEFCYQTNKIIGLQSIIFPKFSREYLLNQLLIEPWTGPDIWFNNIFKKSGQKMAIVKKRLTCQFDGTSLIDNQPKKLL